MRCVHGAGDRRDNLNRAIEIHDSVLESVAMEGHEAILHFSHAYIHQTDGNPGVDAGTGWSQTAVIRIAEAVIDGSFSAWPRDLWDGHLRLDGTLSDNLIPIPLDQTASLELLLEGRGEVITITGSHITLELLGVARYIEDFKCR